MKVVLQLGVVLAVGLALAGCHPIQALKSRANSCHRTQPYMAATSVAPLKIPPGEDKPESAHPPARPGLEGAGPPAPLGKRPLPGRAATVQGGEAGSTAG